MQEQKLMVEAYHVYIEQCIKKMDHHTLYLLDLWELDDTVRDGLCSVDNLIIVWNKINNMRRDNSVTQPDKKRYEVVNIIRILYGKKGWDNYNGSLSL